MMFVCLYATLSIALTLRHQWKVLETMSGILLEGRVVEELQGSGGRELCFILGHP